ARGGAWQVGRLGPQRGQTAGQSRKRSQGRLGQKPQGDHYRAAQRPPAPVRSTENLSVSRLRPCLLLLLASGGGSFKRSLRGEFHTIADTGPSFHGSSNWRGQRSCRGCARAGEDPWN